MNAQFVFKRYLPLLLLLLAAPACLPRAASDESNLPISAAGHAPIYSVTAGRSMPVSVSFEDPGEIAEVRLYFKTMDAASFLFLEMAQAGRDTWKANLPPARNWTKGIDYLLLRTSRGGEARKSKPFRLLVMNDFDYPPQSGDVLVKTEDPAAGGENRDFAVPLKVTVSSQSLLTQAVEDPYPPIEVPGPGPRSPGGFFGGLGGVSFSLKIGGVGFRYGSFSGR